MRYTSKNFWQADSHISDPEPRDPTNQTNKLPKSPLSSLLGVTLQDLKYIRIYSGLNPKKELKWRL